MFLKKKIKQILGNFFINLSPIYQKKIHNFITSEENHKRNAHPEIFDAIFFEIRTRCNSKCNFCAASIQNEIRPDKTMDIELFKKAINELSILNYDGIIAFHVNNDPLLVKNIDEYIKYAKQKCPEAWLQILTNGKSLNNENGKKILESGLNELSINIYSDKDKNHFEIPKNIISFEENILYKIHPINKIRQTENNVQKVDSNILYLKKNNFFVYNKYKRQINEVLTNRAQSSPNKKSNQLPILGFCYFPFSQFNITIDGTVSHCCADFYFSNSMGNIKDQKIIDIWKGEKFSNLRKNLKNNARQKEIMCSGCDNYGVNKPKNIIKKILYNLTTGI